jgi:hypothetical protein
MNRYNDIIKAVEGIDRGKVNKDRQNRFKALVEAYGVEHVALASGLALATVKVYISAKRNIQTIGLEPLSQAEYVFDKIKIKK